MHTKNIQLLQRIEILTNKRIAKTSSEAFHKKYKKQYYKF
jgi:hypothetical protein